MSEMLGQKPQGPRNNTWPNRDQNEGVFGVLGDTLPFDPAGRICVPLYVFYSQGWQLKNNSEYLCLLNDIKSKNYHLG